MPIALSKSNYINIIVLDFGRMAVDLTVKPLVVQNKRSVELVLVPVIYQL